MGNAQHRNRRGARPRSVPHKHGGAGSSGRTTTQLIPPIAPASATGATSAAIPTARSAGEEVSEPAPEPASPVMASASGGLAEEPSAAAGQATRSRPAEASQNHSHGASHTPQSGPQSGPQSEQVEEEAAPAADHAPEGGDTHSLTSAAPPARSRFDRFYAPGQGPRPERAAPPVSPALPTVVNAPSASFRRAERVERAERTPLASEAPDEDDSADYTGPRGDVRGSVGTLVDSLHEIFARDRAIASQGGAARCGVCYLHFPSDELTYRDAEGFYVCQNCAHALGAVRVPMLRRQQRQ